MLKTLPRFQTFNFMPVIAIVLFVAGLFSAYDVRAESSHEHASAVLSGHSTSSFTTQGLTDRENQAQNLIENKNILLGAMNHEICPVSSQRDPLEIQRAQRRLLRIPDFSVSFASNDVGCTGCLGNIVVEKQGDFIRATYSRDETYAKYNTTYSLDINTLEIVVTTDWIYPTPQHYVSTYQYGEEIPFEWQSGFNRVMAYVEKANEAQTTGPGRRYTARASRGLTELKKALSNPVLPNFNYWIEYDRLGNSQYYSALYGVAVVKDFHTVGVWRDIRTSAGGYHIFPVYLNLDTHDVILDAYNGPLIYTRGTDPWKSHIQGMISNTQLALDHATNGRQRKNLRDLIELLTCVYNQYPAPPPPRFSRPVDTAERPLPRPSRP